MLKLFRVAIAAAAMTAGALAMAAGPTAGANAAAAQPTFDRLVAYVRDGNIYVSKGKTERRLTDGGGHARPRWSPNGQRIAYLRKGLIWLMNADGSGKRRLTAHPAAGPAWSPDGRWIAFASAGCIGGPAVYRISATASKPAPEALFPAECRGVPAPAARAAGPAARGTLAERMRLDDAVAWSPDGTRIAFRGGNCESVFDACLSLGNVATGGERVLAAYGGGGQEYSGYAVVPSFRPDGAKVTWTAYQEGHTAQTSLPVHVVEHDLGTGASRRLGAAEDREMVYERGTRALVTGRHKNGSWVLALNLSTGVRTPFHKGSQPAVQP